MARQRVYTGAPWEQIVGYCRALRSGPHVVVTGTVALDEDGSTHGVGDGYAQAKRCLETIAAALEGVDAKLRHVTRTRMFVTDIARWQEFGRAHAECFGEHHPVTTMVEVAGLIREDMLIEIEVDAIVDD
jgi:enamine deaminase RidA (YjgF/YER057c/UK114 family)